MSFAATGKMRYGHVAMVSKVVSDREVLLTHANWSRRGGIERDVRAIDVSSAGDWSQVRIWWGPMGDLGTSANAANGFIYAGDAPVANDRDDSAFGPVIIAGMNIPQSSVRLLTN